MLLDYENCLSYKQAVTAAGKSQNDIELFNEDAFAGTHTYLVVFPSGYTGAGKLTVKMITYEKTGDTPEVIGTYEISNADLTGGKAFQVCMPVKGLKRRFAIEYTPNGTIADGVISAYVSTNIDTSIPVKGSTENVQ